MFYILRVESGTLNRGLFAACRDDGRDDCRVYGRGLGADLISFWVVGTEAVAEEGCRRTRSP